MINLLNGPLQKQILLMKLVHEMERRPDFGDQFDNNPDGEIRLWVARVKAIMDRVSIGKSVSFKASLDTAAQFWKPSINSMQVTVRDAIEELKLDLELSHDDQIGKVYEAGEVYKFNQDLLGIVERAQSSAFVVDPYFDATTFSMMFPSSSEISVNVLMGKGAEAVKTIAAKFSQETGQRAEVRKSKIIHDRLLFIDGHECWLFGASIKDGGRKPTYLMPLQPDLCEKKLSIYKRYLEQQPVGCAFMRTTPLHLSTIPTPRTVRMNAHPTLGKSQILVWWGRWTVRMNAHPTPYRGDTTNTANPPDHRQTRVSPGSSNNNSNG